MGNETRFAQQVGADIKSLVQKLADFEKKVGTLSSPPVKSYLLSWGENMSAGYNDSIARRNLSVKNGVGIIHLDFITTVSGGTPIVARLPDNAPTFEALCDVNIISGGHIWISEGQRAIYAAGIKANTRIIVDIVGFVR